MSLSFLLFNDSKNSSAPGHRVIESCAKFWEWENKQDMVSAFGSSGLGRETDKIRILIITHGAKGTCRGGSLRLPAWESGRASRRRVLTPGLNLSLTTRKC